MKVSNILLPFVLLFMMVSCNFSHPYSVPVDDVEPIKVARFDSLVYRYVNESDSLQRMALKDSAGAFWGIYNYHLLHLSDYPDFYEGLTSFINDTSVAGIYADALSSYSDMSVMEQQLSLMSARYKALFPQCRSFLLQSHISALGMPVVVIDSLISISIDCYLGADYAPYQQRYHRYELPLHSPDALLPDVGEVMLRNTVLSRKGTLLDAMIYEGMIACLLSGLLDDDSAASILRYTPEQEAWCIENEQRIWNTIVEQCHLFTTDKMIINKYIQPAPFTVTLTQEAPGRVGRWVGWRIVQQYIENQDITLMELASDNRHSVEILRLSNYNPRQ